jgi:CRP-like cAMP-binding protein
LNASATEIAGLQLMVDKLAYRVPLSDEDRQALMSVWHQVRRLEQHRYVVREMDSASNVCVLLSGCAMRQKVLGHGQRQILSIHFAGEFLDLQNSFLGIADHSVQMLTPGQVAFIPVTEIDRVMSERPNIARALWVDSLVDSAIFREWIANVGGRDAKTRVAHLLCEFSLRLKVAGLGEIDHYEIPMTQEQLADATGLTAVHINRTLKSLEADGLIVRTSPRAVTIGDWRRLAEVGDFQSAYLHLREDEPALH